MLRLQLNKDQSEGAVAKALQILKKNGIVAYPTESFYALGVIANNKTAVKKLFKLKQRPFEKAIPVIVGNDAVLKSIVKSVPLHAENLIKKFWPGSLTIIFESNNTLPGILTGNKHSVAVRIPGKSFALYLAKAANFPISATSANLSGKAPAQSADDVMKYFGENVDLIIDGGKTPGGNPSTIIDVTVMPPQILRQGSILPDSLN